MAIPTLAPVVHVQATGAAIVQCAQRRPGKAMLEERSGLPADAAGSDAAIAPARCLHGMRHNWPFQISGRIATQPVNEQFSR